MSFLDPETQRENETVPQADASRVLRLVKDHGPESGRWLTWSCPGCGEEMSHPKTIPAATFDRNCYDCQAAIRSVPLLGKRESELAARGVPAEFLAPFVEPPDWPADRRRGDDISAWTGSPWCVMLAGSVGGGKTTMGTELFWRTVQARPGISARWWRAATAVRTVFGAFGEEESKAAMVQLYRSDLLLFDEIGRGHDGKAWSLIVEVISHRHENQLATILTTNRRLKSPKPGAPGAPVAGDREKGLNEEDPALFRRIESGLLVGFAEPWRRP